MYGFVLSGYGVRFHPILGRMEFHSGGDIPGYMGAPIKAAAGGRVVSAGWAGGYGQMVLIDHGNGFRTAYAHLSKYVVRPGNEVVKGQIIAYCGSTGLSTGPHLHYEVRYKNRPINPAPFLDLNIFKIEALFSRLG